VEFKDKTNTIFAVFSAPRRENKMDILDQPLFIIASDDLRRKQSMAQKYDVIIIGAGVVGSAIAREMTRYELKIGVLEKNRDVCFETSGRNSAVIHGGFAYDTGSRKAECCVEGNQEFDKVARELDVPFKRTGKVLVGNTATDYESLQKTIATGRNNGSIGLKMVDKERLHEMAPAVIGEFAMLSPMSGIVDPFQYAIGLAENAKMNGVDFYFDHEVTGIRRQADNSYTVITTQGDFNTGWIVNSAGLGAVKISEMIGLPGYRISSTKGNYIILDKRSALYCLCLFILFQAIPIWASMLHRPLTVT